MDIKQFLSLLRVAHGPNGSGEYMCRCPAHDDRTASLSVREGEGGKILLHCMAGCSTSAVLEAMGLRLSDLFPDDTKGKGGPSRPRKAAKPEPVAPTAPAPQPKANKPLGRLVKVYKYTDEKGETLFEVCRFEREENDQREKTFRQRTYNPKHPKAKQDGNVWSIDGVRSVIYRLPEVEAAIQAGKTIYVVEGEKDADTLAALGFAATTNPGGASKQGASKWLPEHTKLLTGANVVILPDNDAAGINDRQQVAASLAEVCKSVKLLDLTKAFPSLPSKGDITDMLAIMGNVPGVKALHELEMATRPIDATEAKARAARDAVAVEINNVPGYCVSDGCICQWNENDPKRLCNFVAVPRSLVTRDDGVTEEKVMVVDGWTQDGTPLPRARVGVKAYKRMDWIIENWDIRANVVPGTTATDKLRYVISAAGDRTMTRTTEYTHTGWRKINGRWAYLYQGGAIGAEGVTVDLGAALNSYSLDANCDASESELDAATMFPLLADRRITVPLISFVFLAPLRDALARCGFPPAFAMYLVGSSGTRKSTLAALALSYFGQFNSMTLPASFNDTANYVRKKAFMLKDMLLAVDDYHPESSLQERKKMESTAQALSRAFGDGAERGRMNADRSLQESMPPRALALISGEDVPNIGESGTARYYIIHMNKNDIPASEELTYMQDQAAAGTFARLMHKYIEWLAPQMDELPETLSKRFKELRAEAQAAAQGSHSRAPGTIAHLLIGYEMYLNFLVQAGLLPNMTSDLIETEMRIAAKDIMANSRTQGEEAREERPSKMFISTLGELLITQTASVVDLTDSTNHSVGKGCIGYMDAMYYYFLPEVSYVSVCEFYNKKGQAFPLTQRMLYKQLRDDGVLTVDTSGNKCARTKSISGKAYRLLWIARTWIDGPKASTEQQRMNLSGASDGYTEVDDPDNPFTK